MSIKPILFYIKVVQVMVNLGGGQDKPPWTGYPPPLYQLHVVSSFPTLKKVYRTRLVILNPLLF